MFPLVLLLVLILLVSVQALVMKAARPGRSMTTGFPFDPFDPQRLR
jgi:hypothetical protein